MQGQLVRLDQQARMAVTEAQGLRVRQAQRVPMEQTEVPERQAQQDQPERREATGQMVLPDRLDQLAQRERTEPMVPQAQPDQRVLQDQMDRPELRDQRGQVLIESYSQHHTQQLQYRQAQRTMRRLAVATYLQLPTRRGK